MTKGEQRKARQAAHAARHAGNTQSKAERAAAAVPPRRHAPRPRRQPIVGSAEWAETRGDDLGESPDR